MKYEQTEHFRKREHLHYHLSMTAITPFLWFDHQAEEAAKFYVSIFKNSVLGNVMRYAEGSHGKVGSVMTQAFTLAGVEFTALNGGPMFQFTPAISFTVDCETKEELQEIWDELADGGTVMMELQQYPFSEYYGWLNDKYGVSWQLNMTKKPQRINPFLMFVGDVNGKAEEAMKFYTSVFDHSSIDMIVPFEAGEMNAQGYLQHGEFTLDGQKFQAMDGGTMHKFTFSTAQSFIVHCKNQDEVDRYQGALSAVPEAEQCGWVQDKYGVTWQIIPDDFLMMMADEDPVKVAAVSKAMMQMKKLDIAQLEKAYNEA